MTIAQEIAVHLQSSTGLQGDDEMECVGVTGLLQIGQGGVGFCVGVAVIDGQQLLILFPQLAQQGNQFCGIRQIALAVLVLVGQWVPAENGLAISGEYADALGWHGALCMVQHAVENGARNNPHDRVLQFRVLGCVFTHYRAD